MTVTLDLSELVGARIKDNPESMARARRVLAREFAGIDLDAVEAILESFTEEGEDIALEDAFAPKVRTFAHATQTVKGRQ